MESQICAQNLLNHVNYLLIMDQFEINKYKENLETEEIKLEGDAELESLDVKEEI